MADGLMANPYIGLLNMGMSPEQAQAQIDEQRALQFANLNPQQRIASGIYKGITQIGRALGSRDPMLEQASQIRALQQQFDTNTAEGMAGFARALASINPALSAQAGQMAQQALLREEQLGETRAKAQKARAEAAKLELTTQQEEKFRQELSALPDTATEEDMLRIARKYGGTKDIMKGIETAQGRRALLEEKAAAREDSWKNRKEELQIRHENTMLELQQRGADRALLQQQQQKFLESQKEQQRNHDLNMFKLRQEILGAKPLAAGLQKAEDDDLKLIANAAALADTLTTPIQTLKDGTLKLGPVSNMNAVLRNWAGSSNKASQAYADMQRAVQAATNIKVSAEKGVQTDKDVLRFANELTAAAGGKDTKVLLQALENFKDAAEKDAKNVQNRIQSRRKSQNVGLYDFNSEYSPVKPSAPTYEVNRVYQNAKGQRARYLGKDANGKDKWEEL